MELRHLRYFVAVAERLSFRRAAESLHVAQPALSQQIRALEGLLGTQLLERSRQRVSLTDSGTMFLEEARVVLRHAARARQVGERAGRGEIGVLKIGYISSALYSSLFSECLDAYRQARPGIHVSVSMLDSNSQVEEIARGHLDVGFVRSPLGLAVPEIELTTVLREPVILALPRTHQLAAKARISLRALAHEAFVGLQQGEQYGFYESVMGMCARAGLKPGLPIGLTSTMPRRSHELITVIGLVGAGFGVAVVPRSLSGFQHKNVVFRPFSTPVGHTELAIAYRRSHRSAAIGSFVDIAKTIGSRK